jgi:hypothetical protein
MRTGRLVLLLSVLLAACRDSEETASDAADSTQFTPAPPPSWEHHGIKLTLKEDSPQFPDATLSMQAPTGSAQPGQVKFSYTVTNYDLKAQTVGGDHCANSKDGQHIHLILNNEPYLARYTTEFEEELKGGHYVCLSFLSRSYHESIKNGKAYDLRQFTVGAGAKFTMADLSQPFLFYSRPKGEYVGADAHHVLLDFFLVNCDLSETGYKVNLTVNDTAHFTLSKWAPYVIEGMPMGENTIRLQLVDATGALVKNAFNPVERKITLKDGA